MKCGGWGSNCVVTKAVNWNICLVCYSSKKKSYLDWNFFLHMYYTYMFSLLQWPETSEPAWIT